MKNKILLLLLFSIIGLFAHSKAYAYPTCGSGAFDEFAAYKYTYQYYTCDEGYFDEFGFAHRGNGCVHHSVNIYPDCDQFVKASAHACAFCKNSNDTACTETIENYQGAGSLYKCNITHSGPSSKTYKYGSYCNAYEVPTVCGSLTTHESCVPKTVDCAGKCGKWSVNKTSSCSLPPKDCGQRCGTGKTCVVDSTSKAASKTNTGGYCKTGSCNPKTCAQLGYDGKGSSVCEKQSDGCGGTITCGGCNSGLSCLGKNASGAGGICNAPKTSKINVLVFYDHFTKNSQKGTESSYTVCYPSTDGTNKPAGSSPVTFTTQSGDTGIPSKSFTYSSYKNCQQGGNSSSKGYTFTAVGTSTKVNLAVPSGYIATGYNYTVDGKANVRCTGTQKNCTNVLNSTPYLQGSNVTVRFGIKPGTTVSKLKGFVFVDDNFNDQYEPGIQGNNELCFDSSQYGNVSIKYANNSTDSFAQDSACNKYFSYTNTSSAQTIKLNAIPTGYRLTGFEYQDSTHPGTNSNCGTDVDAGTGWCIHDALSTDTTESINLAGESEVHFGITTAPQTFSVSGTIFTDTGKIGFKDAADDDYKTAQPKDVSIYPADDTGVITGDLVNTVTNGNGGYTLSNLDAGTYLVQYTSTNGSGPPSGYAMTYPNNGSVPPSILVNVGNGSPGCWIAKSGQTKLNDAACSGGNITGLNFGVTNSNQPWFQSAGGDIRIDGELKNPVPTGLYASIGIASPFADPGILFTAQPSATLTSGANQSTSASSKGWLSTGNKYKAISGGTRLSYTYLNSVLTRGGVLTSATTGLTAAGYCGPSHSRANCVLTGIPKGVYKIDDTLTITGTNSPFQAGANIIILIPGDLNIKSNIVVPIGTTVVFAVTGNIIVDPSVTQIEGIYSAESKFDTGSGTNALAINGALIANSAGNVSYSTLSNIFTNNRNLATNSTTPSVTFKLRPDFLTNLPETLKVPNYVIQEVAPGPSFSFGTSQGATYTPTPSPKPTFTPTLTPTAIPTPTPAPTAFLESGGAVTMEAKNTDLRTSYSGVSWTNVVDSSAVSGTLIRALPDNGVTFTPLPASEAQYKIYFTTTGTYNVYLRGYANNTSGNTVAVGKNGTPNATYINYSTNAGVAWKNTDNNNIAATISIPSAGLYTFSLWPVDDGVRVDRIALKKTSGAPSGDGPTESTRGTYP